MAISANTNLQSLRLQSSLSKNTNSLLSALERMATGYKVNCAADDAAGYFVATNLNTQIRGLGVANKNISDGMSVLNIAEGSLTNINDMLLRVRDLALQSANGAYTENEREAMQQEVSALLEEITRIKNSTEFNGKNIFGTQTKLDKDQTYTDVSTISTIKTARSKVKSAYSTEKAAPLAAPTDPIETGTIDLTYGISQKVSFGTNVYTLSSNNTAGTQITYSYNKNTGELILNNNTNYSITSAAGQENNITFNGNSISYTGGTEKDIITLNGVGCSINASGGDNVLNINGNSNSIYGGSGKDTVNYTGNGAYIGLGAGDDNLNIKGANNWVYGQGGNDNIKLETGDNNYIYCDSGNNNIEINTNNNYFQGGTGNDSVLVNSGSNNIVDGRGGTNTITDNGTNTGTIGFNGVPDTMPESGRLAFFGQETKTFTIAGKTYTLANSDGSRRTVSYSYNSVTGELSFNADYMEITAAAGQTDKLILNGTSNIINMGDGDDEIKVNSGAKNTINGGDGNDKITLNSNQNTVYGQGGNDNIIVNSNQNYIQDGIGSNTITINSGKNSNIINEENSTTNTIIDNGTKTGIINSPLHPKPLPDAGIIPVLVGSGPIEFEIDGKFYTIENKHATRNGTLSYSIDASGQITFNSNAVNMYITSKAGQTNNVRLTGDNIYFYGAELDDTIVSDGTSNRIYGGAGNDNITLNSGSSCIVYGEDGDDTITIKTNNNTVDAGNGNDEITVTGTSNNISGAAGDDIFNVGGKNNIVRGYAGKDKFIIDGTLNNIYGGVDDDEITINSEGNNAYGEDGNDTIYINSANEGYVASGGNGNDKIYVNSSNAGGISGGNDNDWFYVAAGANNNTVNGGAGTNTLEDHGTNTGKININGTPDSIGLSGTLIFEPGQTLTNIKIGDKTYTINNTSSIAQSLIYSYDNVKKELRIEGNNFNITTGAGQKDKIFLSGNSNTVNTGDGNDEITIEKGLDNKIYAGTGNDKITMNSTNNHIYGEAGDDEIILNASNAPSYVVDGGADDDYITINSNGNSNINGGDGNDIFTNKGSNNAINGGTGNNILMEDGKNTAHTNIARIGLMGASGDVNLNAGETIEIVINGKMYSVKNNNTTAFKLNYALNGTEITLNAEKLEITSASGQQDNLKIVGKDNIINLQDGNDTVKLSGTNNIINTVSGTNNVAIETGSENTVNGGTGNDTITMNSANNNIYGGGGNDNIILNATNDAAHAVDGGAGADTITINSSGNSNVTGGADNDNFIINGNNNAIKGGAGDDLFTNKGDSNTIQGEGGYNSLQENGTNSIIQDINRVNLLNNSGSITMQAGASMDYVIGGKTYTIKNNDSTEQIISYVSSGSELAITANNISITGANGQESLLRIEGDNNTVTTGNQNDTIKIKGSGNIVNANAGNDNILIEGNNNKINGGDGNDTFTLTKGDKNTLDGGNGNDIFINNGTNSTYSNINEKQEIAKPITLQVGSDSSSNSRIEVSLGFMIPIIDFNVTSADNALNVVRDVDALLNTVQSKLSDIGAYQNRLESIKESNTITIENLTAAKSTIMDADIAEESANFLKSQILQNVTTSLLAQANSLPANTIMQLIR